MIRPYDCNDILGSSTTQRICFVSMKNKNQVKISIQFQAGTRGFMIGAALLIFFRIGFVFTFNFCNIFIKINKYFLTLEFLENSKKIYLYSF